MSLAHFQNKTASLLNKAVSTVMARSNRKPYTFAPQLK